VITFETRLKWRKHPEDFSIDQRKILLALSNKKWLWRTLGSLQRATGLSQEALVTNLKELLERGLVKGSVSKETEPVFGLIERVGATKNHR
jgi:DNA-binding MarR family transcriptional regulator